MHLLCSASLTDAPRVVIPRAPLCPEQGLLASDFTPLHCTEQEPTHPLLSHFLCFWSLEQVGSRFVSRGLWLFCPFVGLAERRRTLGKVWGIVPISCFQRGVFKCDPFPWKKLPVTSPSFSQTWKSMLLPVLLTGGTQT